MLPVRWSLERPSVGCLRELGEEQQAATLEELVQIMWNTPRSDEGGEEEAPAGWALPADPAQLRRFGAAAVYGPRTNLVLARAAYLWSGDAEFWPRLLRTAINQDRFRPPGYLSSVARTAARAPGRVEAVERLETAVHGLREGLGSAWAVSQMAALRSLFLGDEQAGPRPERTWRNALALLGDMLEAYLLTEAVADVLPATALTYGQGAVLASGGRPGIAPAPAWSCSDAVASVIGDLLRRASRDQLAEAALGWWRARDEDAYAEVEMALVTGSCHAPPLIEMMNPKQAVASWVAVLSAGEDERIVQEWASSLATVLTERLRLSEVAVTGFLAASAAMPGLAALVHSPLAADPAC